ncbi:hypothetical protein JOC95_000675 [Bacillus tianshenii]|uniref:Uncharacterized protein n=1 Tax=Sutcliffiella tianshenii TaxID=1463404 RepID=A0ABS2NWD0_9BACI|nr:hypothetical protein [Bacillus tianshenii]
MKTKRISRLAGRGLQRCDEDRKKKVVREKRSSKVG